MNNTDDPTPRTRGLLPTADKTNRKGGTHFHKPECRCRPCSARRRSSETVIIGDGGAVGPPGTPVDEIIPTSVSKEPINADALIIAPIGKRSSQSKRVIIADWIKLRTINPDITNIEAARQMGISKQYLYLVINQATREGWLRFEDPLARIEHQIIPKALDNINNLLDEGDKLTSLEVAKGTIWKTYQEAKGVGQGSMTVLALKIELPPSNGEETKIIEGQIIGKPKILTNVIQK